MHYLSSHTTNNTGCPGYIIKTKACKSETLWTCLVKFPYILGGEKWSPEEWNGWPMASRLFSQEVKHLLFGLGFSDLIPTDLSPASLLSSETQRLTLAGPLSPIRYWGKTEKNTRGGKNDWIKTMTHNYFYVCWKILAFSDFWRTITCALTFLVVLVNLSC